jgi:Amt family ammonium transporter
MTASHSINDVIWVLTCGFMVMLMQAGFCCLETGLVRAKNSINVAVKNFIDFCISSATFFVFGFAIMFGASWCGLFGTTGYLFNDSTDTWRVAFFFFQLVFCGAATTIVAGAVAERMRYSAYLVVSAIVSGLIYPFFGHWAWGGSDGGQALGWLNSRGFIDFAGSSVVHSVGGWVSLAAIMIIGPRFGRFGKDAATIRGHDLPMATLGAFLLWFGWFGFNGGSTLAVTDRIPLIVLNTNLSAAFGALAVLALSWQFLDRPDVVSIMNGALAGLVGITGSANIMTPAAAVLIGTVSGVLSFFAASLLEKLEIDDAVGAVPVHCVAGVWGTIAVALFADPAAWGTGLGRWEQLGIQLAGVATCCAWSFGLSYCVLWLVNRWLPLRVGAEAEWVGLNVSEHGASTEILDLLNEMELHRQSGVFTKHTTVEPHTEAGQIAAQYNRVLDRVAAEAENSRHIMAQLRESDARTRAIMESALDCIITIDDQGRVVEFNPAAERVFQYRREDVLGRDMAELIVPPSLRDQHRKGLMRFLTTGQGAVLGKRIEIIAQRADGSEFPVELAIVPIRQDSGYLFTAYLRDITEVKNREAELGDLNRKLIDTSRLAGKAEVATGVLHNVGNTLNSVNVSVNLITERLKAGSATGLAKASALIEQHSENLGEFITHDPKGRHLPEYLKQLSKQLATERDSSLDELRLLTNHVEHIKEVVSMQQSYANVAGVIEPVQLAKLVEDAIKVNDAGLIRHGVDLDCDFQPIPQVTTDKHKVLQILINLISNAKYAVSDSRRSDKRMTVRVAPAANDRVQVMVGDNGVGIPAENLTRIFQHGFTTRKDGHGFGLHSCAIAARELGGALVAQSEGPDMGATFVLELPLQFKETHHVNHDTQKNKSAPAADAVAAAGLV